MLLPSETQEPAHGLLELLEKERTALLGGDVAALAALLVKKEALIEALEGDGADPQDARNVASAAASNQHLLQAAIEGLQAARARLDILNSGGPPLSTYGADGHAETHVSPSPSVERRA